MVALTKSGFVGQYVGDDAWWWGACSHIWTIKPNLGLGALNLVRNGIHGVPGSFGMVDGAWEGVDDGPCRCCCLLCSDCHDQLWVFFPFMGPFRLVYCDYLNIEGSRVELLRLVALSSIM